MDVVIEGDASPGGWPVPDCRCASCRSVRAAPHAPLRVLVDGTPLDELAARRLPGGFAVTAPDGGDLLCADPGGLPEPEDGIVYEAVLLDLLADPSHLGALRASGAVGPRTSVHAVHLDHRIRDESELTRRLAFWTSPPTPPHRTLLLGGSRSGKSAEAELRLAAHPHVTYVATGPTAEADPDWARRVGAHKVRRPPGWATLETTDLDAVLRNAEGPLLIDGLGTWLAAAMDETGAWESPDAVLPRLDSLTASWRAASAVVVAVSDEVGLSLVPDNRAGRLFRDFLGDVNQRLAAESEDVALVVAGRVVAL